MNNLQAAVIYYVTKVSYNRLLKANSIYSSWSCDLNMTAPIRLPTQCKYNSLAAMTGFNSFSEIQIIYFGTFNRIRFFWGWGGGGLGKATLGIFACMKTCTFVNGKRSAKPNLAGCSV